MAILLFFSVVKAQETEKNDTIKHYQLEDIEIKSSELSDLISKYNLISIEKMYVRKRPENELAKERLKETRADSETEAPDLDDVYLLKFPMHTNMDELISEYESLDEVIYAEENAVMSVCSDP